MQELIEFKLDRCLLTLTQAQDDLPSATRSGARSTTHPISGSVLGRRQLAPRCNDLAQQDRAPERYAKAETLAA